MKTRILSFVSILLFATDLLAQESFKSGDLWYAWSDNGLEVCSPKDGGVYSGDIVIPEYVTVTVKDEATLEDVNRDIPVTLIGSWAFKGCNGLTLHVPKSVARITPNAFEDCSETTLVIQDLSAWCNMNISYYDVNNHPNNPSYLEDEKAKLFLYWIDWLVLDGQHLTSIEIPDGVTALGNVFRGYKNLVSVDLPASLSSIGRESFEGCENLTSVFVHREAPFTIIPTAFLGINSSCVLYVPKDLKEDFIECGWTENLFRGGVIETDEVPVSTGIGITKANFSDKNFRSRLRLMKEGEDGIFSETDIQNIKKIEVHSQGENQIVSLKGIELFTNLETLRCYGNNIVEVDLSRNLQLKNLYISRNPISSLDVTGNLDLRTLECYDCKFTSLDVSKNSNLTRLWCGNNQLSSLNLSNCPNLSGLTCYNNLLTSLDLSNNHKLYTLECYSNELTELNIEGCGSLTYLNCDDNHLTELNVSGLESLTDLLCQHNSISSLDLTKASKLQTFYCSFNQLKSLDLTNCQLLTKIVCNANQLTELLLPVSTTITDIDCCNNQLEHLDVSGCSMLNRIICNNNLFTGENLDNLIESLPSPLYSQYRKYYFDFLNEEGDGNNISMEQIQAVKDRHWTPRKCYGDMLEWTELDVSTGITEHEAIRPSVNIYNLSGMQIKHPQKGINIINGKKIIQK